MTRIEKIRNMPIEEMAKAIIRLNVTDEYCKSDCEGVQDIDGEGCLPGPEKECCMRWLEEDVE